MSKARANGASKSMTQDGDICPVCKSSRYLNPDMRFKINSECYHKMCESCVDRIFSHGPAPCPIAGCSKTLRGNKFRTPTFDDLKIEREVDIRKRVMRAMTKTEDDFETLRDYNDYLEQVEELTWNLILHIDVDATETRLRKWEDHQKAQSNAYNARREAERGNTQRKAPSAPVVPVQDVPVRDDKDTGFSFHGLKKRATPPKEAPFDPFEGWDITPQFYQLQDDYEVEWYRDLKTDQAHVVGAWDAHEYSNRLLREAFGGFGIFIDEELAKGGGDTMDVDVV